MKVAVNGRAFVEDEPGGSVGTALKHTKQLICHPNINTSIYGHPSLNKNFEQQVNVRSPFFPISSTAYGLFWERSVLPSAVARDEIDILYCPNANAPIHNPSSYKIVVTLYHLQPKMGESKIEQIYRRLLVTRGIRSADAVITVSEYSKESIASLLGIDPKKIYVVYSGVDEIFRSAGSADKMDLPDKYILYVGALSQRKNIPRLIKAFKKIKQKSKIPHKLVLVGSKDKLIFSDVDIEDNDDIVTPGFAEKPELKYAYQNADLFVFPSLYEGFGLAPLEAAACDTPVVASNKTALPEVLDDGARYVNPNDIDSIAEGLSIVERDDELDNLRRKSSARASEFTWEKTGNRLFDVFESIVSR